jgi:LAO/AO transport system kinase
VNDFGTARRASGEFARNRAQQAREWLRSETAASLLALLEEDPALAARLAELESEVAAGRVPPRVAADELTARLRRQLATTGGT